MWNLRLGGEGGGDWGRSRIAQERFSRSSVAQCYAVGMQGDKLGDSEVAKRFDGAGSPAVRKAAMAELTALTATPAHHKAAPVLRKWGKFKGRAERELDL
jgi:hypothetical protein